MGAVPFKQVLQGLGGLFSLWGLAGLVSLFFLRSSSMYNSEVLGTQVFLKMVTIAGGIGLLLLQDWGRKLLWIPLFQILAVLPLFILYGSSGQWGKSLIFQALAFASLVFLLLPFTGKAIEGLGEMPSRLMTQALGAFTLLLVLVSVAVFLLLMEKSLEGYVYLVLFIPFGLLLAAGSLGCLFAKNWGKNLLMGFFFLDWILALVGWILWTVWRNDAGQLLYQFPFAPLFRLLGISVPQEMTLTLFPLVLWVAFAIPRLKKAG
ncbi:MAG: hypothetical protein U1F57_03580 [bacterium]